MQKGLTAVLATAGFLSEVVCSSSNQTASTQMLGFNWLVNDLDYTGAFALLRAGFDQIITALDVSACYSPRAQITGSIAANCWIAALPSSSELTPDGRRSSDFGQTILRNPIQANLISGPFLKQGILCTVSLKGWAALPGAGVSMSRQLSCAPHSYLKRGDGLALYMGNATVAGQSEMRVVLSSQRI